MSIFTFHDLLTHNLTSRAEQTAVIDGERQVSYRELSDQVDVASRSTATSHVVTSPHVHDVALDDGTIGL